MDELKAAHVSIVLCAGHLDDLPTILAAADTAGLLSTKHAWVLYDMVDHAIILEQIRTHGAAHGARLHGLLNFKFDAGATSGFERLRALWRELSPEACANDAFEPEASLFSSDGPPAYAALAFDAVAALVIALNASKAGRDQMIDRGQLNQALRTSVRLEGASGPVALDMHGDRSLEGAHFALDNFVHNASDVATDVLAIRRILLTTTLDNASSIPVLGQASCPCLRSWAEGPTGSTPPANAYGGLIASVDGSQYVYPPTYGQRCRPHDVGLSPSCNNDNPATWCSQSWCYVHPDRCSAPNSQSLYFPGQYFYSYATCRSAAQVNSNDVQWKGGFGRAPVDLLALGCPPGYEPSGGSSSSSCEQCAPGSSKGVRANFRCAPCPIGTSQPSPGAAACVPCSPGLHQPLEGRTACSVCPRRTTSLNGSAQCICDEGFYADASGCQPCLEGAVCELGVTRATLRLRAGFWRHNRSSLDLKRCPSSAACVGGVNDGHKNVSAYCAPGLSGTFCHSCLNSTAGALMYQSTRGGSAVCAPCKLSPGAYIAIVMACILGAMVSLSLLLLALRQCLQPTRLSRYLGATLLGIKAKLLFGFFAIATRVPSVYEIALPGSISNLLSFFDFLTFGGQASNVVYTCAGFGRFEAKLIFWVVAPAALVALCLLSVLARRMLLLTHAGGVWTPSPISVPPSTILAPPSPILVRRTPHPKGAPAAARPNVPRSFGRTILLDALPSAVRLLFLLCTLAEMEPTTARVHSFCCTWSHTPFVLCTDPIVTNVAFEAFSCVEFDEGSYSRLNSDLLIECSTPYVRGPRGTYHATHARMATWGLVAVGLYSIGIIALNGTLLFSAQHDIRSGKMGRLGHSIAFLHRDFRTELFWWELVEMSRRLVLVGGALPGLDVRTSGFWASLAFALQPAHPEVQGSRPVTAVFVLLKRGSIVQLGAGLAYSQVKSTA